MQAHIRLQDLDHALIELVGMLAQQVLLHELSEVQDNLVMLIIKIEILAVQALILQLDQDHVQHAYQDTLVQLVLARVQCA